MRTTLYNLPRHFLHTLPPSPPYSSNDLLLQTVKTHYWVVVTRWGFRCCCFVCVVVVVVVFVGVVVVVVVVVVCLLCFLCIF